MSGPRVCVAQIGAAHGIRGEVRLRSFTAEPEAVRRYGPFETDDGKRVVEIVSLRPQKEMFIARLKGIDDRNAAETLRNVRLYVPRERLGDTGEDEFFHADLIGLAVHDRDGGKLGTIAALENFGAGDLIEIAPADGGATYYLPFNKRVVPEIDIAAGRIIIDPPAEIEADGEGA